MEDFIATIEQEVASKIEVIESTEKNILKRASAASDVLEDAFFSLKEFVSGYRFVDEREEIIFFKDVKPRIFCKLLYYRKVYNIEMNRPMGTEEEQTRYLNGELILIQQYISKRLDFYRYIRSGETHLDREYFLRDSRGSISQYLDSFYFERDPKFSTGGDFRVAKILANDMLQVYIREGLEKIRQNHFVMDDTPQIHLDTPRWTESKTGLIEILHSLDALGCVDNGKISLSRLAAHFEQGLDIRLGNISRGFNDMKFRSNPTAFLDKMREALLKKIENIESKELEKNLKRNSLKKKEEVN